VDAADACTRKCEFFMERQLVIAIVFLILAIVVFAFAGGARRIYSGGFFALIGVVMLFIALKKKP
jgi:hypothetical protein